MCTFSLAALNGRRGGSMPTASELPIDIGASAEEMAIEMFGSGITIVSASYTGNANASGTYSDGNATAPGVTPSDTGVILSTGNASSITNSSGDANVSTGTSTNHGASGDADLAEISGQTTFDASVFQASFIPDGSTLTMQVVFSSEEYLEYVNSGFNDAVGIWVNGEQAELQVGTGHISIDEINDQSNENLYIDNPASAEDYNTEMDGFTVTLTLKAPVIPGEENTIKIGIADGGDGALDSNLLIAGNSVQTALVAGDDNIEVTAGSPEEFDLLANDTSATGSTLTIVEINGQPVVVGDTVLLATGEEITLTETGLILADPDADSGTNSFTYTVQDEDGNTDVGLVNLTTAVPCFASDTLIMTSKGEVLIESLRPGDMIQTLDHGLQPLRWIGSRQLTQPELVARPHLQPITISVGALAPGLPNQNLIVSPQHRVLLSSKIAKRLFGSMEVLVAVKKLQAHPGIDLRMNEGSGVTYWHILFDDHQIVFSNGALTESLYLGQEGKKALSPSATAEIKELFPQLWSQARDTLHARKVIERRKQIEQLVAQHKKNSSVLFENGAAWIASSKSGFVDVAPV
jgi:hypothetical protein